MPRSWTDGGSDEAARHRRLRVHGLDPRAGDPCACPAIEITGLDSFACEGSRTDVEPLRKLGVRMVEGDIRNPTDLAALPAADWMLECAAEPSVLAGGKALGLARREPDRCYPRRHPRATLTRRPDAGVMRSTMSSPAFAAVITRDHLAKARVLAGRLRRFHEQPLYVLCVDELAGLTDISALPFRVLTLDDILPADRRAMTFFYSAFELCNAVRPLLHRWLLQNTSHDRWLYLDADIFPFGPLGEAFEQLEFASLLLSPHVLSPPSSQHARSLETINLKYGVYNSGFLGIRRCAEAERFIDWFADRLATLSFRGWQDVFVDQLWLNLVPVYFGGVKGWRHPGANVGNWNLYERTLARAGDGYTANGQPLLFTHMSNWRFDAPEDWTLGRPLAQGSDATIIADIGRAYRDALAAAGHEDCRTWPYGFGSFTSGRPITQPMRRYWYERWMAGDAPTGSPFDHPEWFRGARYVEWKKFVPLSVKRFLHRSMSDR